MPSTQRTPGPVREVARAALVIGAFGSLAALFSVARRQQSIALLLLFVAWDVAPFVVLALLDRASAAWRFRPRVALYVASILVSAATLVVYGYVALHGMYKPAAPFLVVPPASLILAVIIISLATNESVKQRGK